MKNIYGGNAVYALLIVAFLALGCGGLAGAETDGRGENRDAEQNEIGFRDGENPAQTENEDVSAVVGTYERDTEKDGEGFDNSLEITDAGGGRLYVYLSGSYIYRMGETQSMHEAEGKGEAVLRGDRAEAVLVDEEGKPCRALIFFERGAADVRIPDTCRFNVDLGGLYKKAGSNAARPAKEKQDDKEFRRVRYEEMMDFINDFDARKVGEAFIVTDVPPAILNKKNRADQFGNKSYKGLYYLEGVTDDDMVSYSVLTSETMIESLGAQAGDEPASLRMTAVIVESRGKFDVYRLPFITKIDALDADGAVMWTAEGGAPKKTSFTH
jgi:hypothetical protein